jgi:hypothetical protein
MGGGRLVDLLFEGRSDYVVSTIRKGGVNGLVTGQS